MKFEERFLLEDLAQQFGGVRLCERRLQAFNAAWARLQTDEPGWPTDAEDRAFQESLQSWLRFHAAMLVGELVPEALRFIRANPESPFRPRFAHVLVDEYQDLNRAEQALLDALAEGATFTIVGDEDQSIYSFKFAHPDGIGEFHVRHPGTVDEQLDECRRCPWAIVTMANHLITGNGGRAERELVPTNGALNAETYIVQWPTVEAEIEGIAQFVDRRVRSGEVEQGRVLVLSPRRQFGYMLRDHLNQLGTNAQSFFHEEALDGDPKEMDDSEAQQAFTLLTLVARPQDPVALRCWCGFGSSSLHRAAWSRLRSHCERTGEQLTVALDRLADGDLHIAYTGGIAERYRGLRRILADLEGISGQHLLDRLFPQGSPWAEPFQLVGNSIDDQDYGPMRLLEELRAAVIQPELPTDVDYVRIMSLHKSKGLTADLVIVIGCIEGLIPFLDSTVPQYEQQRSLNEQRRLFYVAITRTRRTLVLSSVAALPRALAHRIGARVVGGNRTVTNAITSRFVEELGPTRPQTIRGVTLP